METFFKEARAISSLKRKENLLKAGDTSKIQTFISDLMPRIREAAQLGEFSMIADVPKDLHPFRNDLAEAIAPFRIISSNSPYVIKISWA